ncbi:MAG: fibrobacter succinogenes major paralogous domain-containing protein, partial [Prevotella sp.]|nr:fibrobacter succinogenes major paralogous domain-containing protein [Prevotella sp.]
GRSYTQFGTYGSTGDTFGGPVTATDAETTYAGKFITNSSAETFNDWLNLQNDFLWSGENAQGPCPDGWRVPTEAELTVLKERSVSFDTNRLKISGDVAGQNLYLPAAGFRDPDGTWYFQGGRGFYWSSSIDSNSGTSAMRLYFNGGSPTMTEFGRGGGFSVRCIQD